MAEEKKEKDPIDEINFNLAQNNVTLGAYGFKINELQDSIDRLDNVVKLVILFGSFFIFILLARTGAFNA